MLIKSVLVLLSVTQLVFLEPIDVQLQNKYKILTDCQKTCNVHEKSADPKSPFRACQVGCNYITEKGDKCVDGCKADYTGVENLIDVCTKSCQFKVEPVAMDHKDVESNSDVKKPEKPIENVDKPTDDNKKDEPIGIVNNLEDLFNKLINPNGMIVGNNNEDGDDDSNSSSNEEKEIKIEDNNKPTDEKSTDLSTGFSFSNLLSRASELAKKKLFGGNFIYTAKLLENGTLVETIREPESLPTIDGDNIDSKMDETPFKILNALLGDEHHFMSLDNDHIHEHQKMRPLNGLEENWKGRPLPIGKPIVEPLDETNPSLYPAYRICRPIKFHFSTLCHDINNFFTCASMRTGLPRWFFLSLILLCSFFLIWLGIFMISMIRRMKRQERIIYYEEDQLPLYKDIVIEEKLPPTYQAEPLPEKVKLETI